MPTNFLWSTGTSTVAGVLSTTGQITLISTEAVSLINSTSSTNGFCVSAVTGSSGVFFSSDTRQALYGIISYYMGSPGSTTSALSAAASVSGWFMPTFDGVTFESSLSALARNPDFIVPMPATTIGSSTSPFMTPIPVPLPPVPFRVMLANYTGQTLGGSSSSPFLRLVPVAPQY